jgi:hypothetical protein
MYGVPQSVSLLATSIDTEGEPIFTNWDVWAHAPSKSPGYMVFAPNPVSVPDYSVINFTLLSMQQEIVEIKKELVAQRTLIEQALSQVECAGLGIEIEEVDDTVAHERILKLFSEHSGSLFYDQIAERLKLPLRQTVEICNQLEQEGLIGEPTTK